MCTSLGKTHTCYEYCSCIDGRGEKAEKPFSCFFRAYGHHCVKSTVVSVLTIVLVQYEMVRCRLACLPYATLPGNSTPLKSNKYERSITPHTGPVCCFCVSLICVSSRGVMKAR